MSPESPLYDELLTTVNASNVLDDDIVPKLRLLSIEERERLSFATKTVTVYLGDEVAIVKKAEEDAALAARPQGYSLEQLNGLNIGCAGRTITPYLIPVDIARDQGNATGPNGASSSAFLSSPEDLPFKPESVDYIVALHMLEHVPNPAEVVSYWLSLVKQGGGIGLILPDWRYTWSSKNDHSEFGHKWNSEPDTVRKMWTECWSDVCDLEALDTTPFKLSFDVVLRKKGDFQPFSLSAIAPPMSGAELAKRGLMRWG